MTIITNICTVTVADTVTAAATPTDMAVPTDTLEEVVVTRCRIWAQA